MVRMQVQVTSVTGQLLVFGALMVAALIVLGVSALFGHGDHDTGGHDAHLGSGDGPTVSFLSPRVFATFLLGFSAAGLVATEYRWSPLAASGAGVGAGLVFGWLARMMFSFFYSQQSDSSMQTSNAIGSQAEVTVPIPDQGNGEVSLTIQGRFQVFPARAQDGRPVPKGRVVKVVGNNGGILVVSESARS
jgi:membrane protein implicated in regulation of membrane protease activity